MDAAEAPSAAPAAAAPVVIGEGAAPEAPAIPFEHDDPKSPSRVRRKSRNSRTFDDDPAIAAARGALSAAQAELVDGMIDDVALSACAPIAEPGAILDPEMVTRARRRSRNSKTLDDDPAFMAAKQSVANAISAVS